MSKQSTSCAMRGDNKCHKHECCERPAPMPRAGLMHQRGQSPSNIDQHSTECYFCNHICRCDTPQVQSPIFKPKSNFDSLRKKTRHAMNAELIDMNHLDDNSFTRTRGEN